MPRSSARQLRGTSECSHELPFPDEFAAEITAKVAALPSATTAELRAVRRDFSRQLAGSPETLVLNLALRLIARQVHSLRFIAYELVHHHRPALKSLNSSRLEQLGSGLDSWAAVDTFACYLSGPAWREHQVADGLIHGWARLPDRWWRRAALVSTVPLNNKARGGSGDALRTLAVCELLLNDRDDMIVKAMSWSLRALAGRDPTAVTEFLSKHRPALAPRVIREVSNKLRTGRKNPRR